MYYTNRRQRKHVAEVTMNINFCACVLLNCSQDFNCEIFTEKYPVTLFCAFHLLFESQFKKMSLVFY